MFNNFFKYFSVVFLLVMLLFPQNSFAQLSGTKTIPGDYATIDAAITDLNTQGVGAGGVTFNIAAGYTESITAPILLTATGTASDPIVFQKNGSGANPLVTRTDAGTLATSTLGAQGDAVIIIQGSDYVTFDGIDVATNDQGIEYGYYLRKASPTDGCKYVTIKNCVVDLTKGTSAYVAGIYSSNNDPTSTVSSATGITVTSTGGRNEYVTITGNTIQDVFAGIVLRGYNHSTSPYDFYDQNFVVGASGQGNIIQNYGGNSANTTYGVYLIYHNNPNISYNTINNIAGGGSGFTSTGYGIFFSSSTASSGTYNNNNINLTANTGQLRGIMFGASGISTHNVNNNTIMLSQSGTNPADCIYAQSLSAGSTLNINNNTFSYGTFASTTGSYLIYANNAANDITVTGNQTSGTINKTGAGQFNGYYNFGSPSGGTANITNNNFSNITLTGASTFYGIQHYTATSQVMNISNNTISNITLGTSTGYGIYQGYGAAGTTVNGNNIYGWTGAGSMYGLYLGASSGPTSMTVYNNNVYNLASTGTLVVGMYNSLGTANQLYKNQVYNLEANNAAGLVYGVQVAGGTATYVYNNFISDLRAPITSNVDAIRGVNITSTTATSSIGLYYNSIYLNASSTGTNFGTTGIYHTVNATATTAALDMRNNIVVNNSTANGTGFTVAYRRSGTALNNYSNTSNNNDFYAGTPSASNLIFYDGTNSDQTMATYKTRVAPRDAASFTENPPFINVSTTPYNLHINTAVATQTESGGVPVTSPVAITDDFDGNTRNATTPDVGADEFNGIALDLNPPVISFTPLGITGSLTNRTLTAAITDPSGVPTSGIGLPVLYWKIGKNGSYAAVTGSYVSGDNYSFSFGGGVTVGDTVFYYVVAQDAATTPNVGVNPSAGAGGFTANPPAVSTPPTSPYGYFIVGVPLAGDYTVGTTLFNRITGLNLTFEKVVNKVMKEVDVLVEAPQIKDEKGEVIEKTAIAPITGKQLMEVEETTWIPMENGKPYTGDLYIKKSEHPEMVFPENTDGVYATITAAVGDLNLRGVSGPTRFLLTDASYSTGETYPITIYVANENIPTATNTVTIKPAVGVTATVTGATAQNVFGIYDSYVTIDGSNTVGGTTRDLTIVNTYTGGTFNLGVVMWNGSGKVATNTTIKNCIIEGSPTPTSSYGLFLNATGGGYHNTSLINNKIQNCRVGIQFVGADGNKSNNGLISGNIIGDNTKPLKQGGILAGYVDNLTITGNDIFGEVAGNANNTQYGIQFLTGSTNSKVQKNKIHDFYYTGTTGYGCFGIRYNSDASTVTEISNNFIHNIKSDGDGSSQNYFSAGIYIITGGNINLYYNSIYMSGNTLGQGTSYNGRSACVSVASGITLLNFRNNIFQNSMGSYPGSTRTNTTYAVYSASANTAYTDINYNDYFVDGVGPRVGYLGADQLDLTAWQTATGKDANSISADPKFESNTDLHIQTQYNIVDGKAQPIASVLTDIDGDARNATTPDIGGDEYTFAPPSVLDPTGVTATAISGDQIDIAFTPNANNNNVVIVYNLTGTFTAPTGTPTVGQPLAGGEVIAITTTSPYSHTGLNQLTHYYYKLFSYNGTDYSPGIIADATTPCAPISTFPWTESFGATFPTCWSFSEGAPGASYHWTTTTADASHGASGPQSGTHFMYLYCYLASTTYNPYYLTTPEFILGATAKQVKYYYYLGASGYQSSPDPLTLQISTDQGATWTDLYAHNSTNSTFGTDGSLSWWTLNTVNLSAYVNKTVTFRFKANSNYGLGFVDQGIDEFVVEDVPSYPIFSVVPASKDFGTIFAGDLSAPQNFIITNTGAGTLTISSGSLTGTDADQFILSSETYPMNIGSGASDTITVTFAPTSAGTKNANLELTHNAAGTPSVIPLTGKALPAGTLYEDFTGTTFPPAGWLAVNNDGGTSNWVRSTLKYNSPPASAMSSYESSGIRNNDWLISPKVTVASGDSIIFFMSAYSSSFPETMVLKVGSSPNPNGSWTTIDSITTSLTTWQRKAYSLSAFVGQNVYIAFVNRSQDKYYLFIDDVMGPVKYVTQNDIGLTAYSQPTTESTFFTGVSRDLAKKDPNIEVQKLSISLVQEVKNKTNGGPIDFKVIVQNYGAATQNSYQIGWQIDNNVQTSVNNTKALAPGASDTLTLTWATPVAGIHTSRAWTILAGDENPMNDTSATISFYAVPDNSVFLEGFEDATFPPTGWLDIDADGSGISWFQGSPLVFSALTGYGYAGSNFQGANSSGVIDQWLITPNTGSASTDTDSLVFYMRTPNGSMWPDSVQILVSTTGTNISDFTNMLGYFEVPMNGQWNKFAYVLPNSANRYIAFRYLIYDADVNSNYIGLDLVEIQRHTSTPSTFPLSVNVNDGWNMVSVPGTNPNGMGVGDWWPGKVGDVYKYSGGYQSVTTTVPGIGYWMKNNGAQTYNTGDEWPSGGIQIVSHDPISALSGWNIFGGYELSVGAAGVGTNPSGLQQGSIFKYSGGYQPATTIDPGYGYWIKLTGAGQIIIPNSLAKGEQLKVMFPSDWGKLIVTDASGISYTLYSVNGEVDLNQYELPPLPPAGMFDIRYSSDRIAEDLSSSVQTIEMQGVTYPLTVRVDNMDIRLMDETGKLLNQNLKKGEEIIISNSSIQKLLVSSQLIPTVYSLEQNYPNPFNPSTVIEFSLPENVENVRLTIYSILGERVAELVNGKLDAGKYKYSWNAGNVSTGMYIYELRTDKFVSVKKMLLLK